MGLSGSLNCRYQFYDIYMAGYSSDFKNWDLAIITLEDPIGVETGWMGVKSLPPEGACAESALTLAKLHTVGYPVEEKASNIAYEDTCDLNVRHLLHLWERVWSCSSAVCMC
jgi:hypothetical protein